jgi:Variant SH3 domain
VLNPAPADPSVRWKPQIRGVTLRSGVTVPPIAVTHPERSPKVQDEFPPTPKSGPSVSPLPSPPPVHTILGLYPIPLPSFPQESRPADIPPPTPMRRSPRRTASTPVRESFDLPPVPSPSPRSASFQYMTDNYPAPTVRASLASLSSSSKSLPRLMVVTTPFESTLQDELALRTGETLRLIREFDDEWCLVQRVGRPDAEKGVVPRFCLSERPRVIKNYVRLSNSIFNNVRRK